MQAVRTHMHRTRTRRSQYDRLAAEVREPNPFFALERREIETCRICGAAAAAQL